MADIRVTVVTVDDDAHGCYLDGRLVGTHEFLGSDAVTAFLLMARWLGFTAASIEQTPETFARVGGTWPPELWGWAS